MHTYMRRLTKPHLHQRIATTKLDKGLNRLMKVGISKGFTDGAAVGV